MRGSYIVSVMSRISATFLPAFTICRMAKGRPSTHMLRCTPIKITLSMPRSASKLMVS